MNLKPWEYFIAVAEELHFGKAAAQLHMAQPPLSRQIQQLERELGVQLLERTNRRVKLTPAGEVFLKQARKTLEQASHAVQLTRRTHHGEAGHLTIGFVTSASSFVLPGIIRKLRVQYPNVDLTLKTATSLEQISMLQQDQLDVGLIREEGVPEDLHTHVVRKESLAAIIPPGHPLSNDGRINLSDLASVPLILYPRADHPAIYDKIVAHCHLAGFEPMVAQEANETAIVGLVAAGLGIALVIGEDHVLPPKGPSLKLLGGDIPSWCLVLAWKQNSQLISNLSEVISSLCFT
jgi:DNA-binding transcriptional LysR family regulator